MSLLKVCPCCSRVYSGVEDLMIGTTRWRICSDENLWFNCSCQTTLVIVKGRFDWYSPALFFQNKSKNLFLELKMSGRIPYLPAELNTLLKIIEDPHASSQQIAQVVLKEPFIAAELLKIGSAMSQGKERQLEHIVSFVGRNTLSALVTGAAIRAFPLETESYTTDEHWFEAHCAAYVSYKIGEFLQEKSILDEIYVSACFVNLGRLIGAIWKPDAIDALRKRVEALRTPWRLAQSDLFPYSLFSLGEIGAVLWGLPDAIRTVASIDFLNAPDRGLSDKNRHIAAIAHLGHQISLDLMERSFECVQDVLVQVKHELGLSNENIEVIKYNSLKGMIYAH